MHKNTREGGLQNIFVSYYSCHLSIWKREPVEVSSDNLRVFNYVRLYITIRVFARMSCSIVGVLVGFTRQFCLVMALLLW
jgi:hypothetical protein